MKFQIGTHYAIFTHNSHMVVSVARKGEGNLQLAEPSTSNPNTGEIIQAGTELEYVGRTELEGAKGKVPTFRTPNGTLIQGHSNNFDPETEYNKDKVRNRTEENAAKVKPEALAKSIQNIFTALVARDAKEAYQLAARLVMEANEAVADMVIDGIEEEEAA